MCREMRLDWKALGEELLVEVLACLLTHEYCATLLVLQWSACAAHHLQNIHDWVVDIAVLLALIGLDAHDDDHIAGNGKRPRSILDDCMSAHIGRDRGMPTLEAMRTWIAPCWNNLSTIRLSCLLSAS